MQDKHKTEHSKKTPVIPRVFTSSNSDGKLRTYCHECKVNEYTLVLDFDENKRPIVRCLRCGWSKATPLFFTFANFDGDFLSFCHICKIDEPTLVIGVDENKQPAIKCLRCGYTLASSEIELKNLYPAFVKNTRLLGQALREMVKKTLAHAESPPARTKPKLMPTVIPVVKPETAKAMPIPASEPEPKPANPEPELVQKIVRLVLSHLEDSWTCRKIPGESLRRYVAKISGRHENAVWKLLFPAHVVKLHTTDFFILRDDKHRPKGYEGFLDDNGVLPIDEPTLF
jgi:predicted nucleic-acid-binding Zn-ribbon protein